MKIGFVIPARLKSTRLPKKVLMKLGNQTALDWTIDRAREAKSIDEVVVATTALKSDSEITKICIDKNTRYFMGDGDDVLDRLRGTADYFDFDYIIALTPDNTLFSVYMIELMVNAMKENPSGEYFRFVDPMYGIGIYGLKKEALDVVCDFKSILDTEIWGHLFHEKFYNIIDLDVPDFLRRDYRLTMDTDKDFIMISKIYRDLNITSDNIVDLDVIIDYLDNNPEVANINKQIAQSQLDTTIIKKIEDLYNNEIDKFTEIKSRVYKR